MAVRGLTTASGAVVRRPLGFVVLVLRDDVGVAHDAIRGEGCQHCIDQHGENRSFAGEKVMSRI